MTKDSSELLQTSNLNKITLRLLSGVLNGCEFALEATRILVIVNNTCSNDMFQSLDEIPADTLFLPVNLEGNNFEILFAEGNSKEFLIRELSEKGIFESKGIMNTVLTVGDIVFALKESGDDWSKNILKSEHNNNILKKRKLSATNSHYLFVFILVTTFMFSVFLVSVTAYNNESNYMHRLNSILPSKELIFIEGRDHILYIVAQDRRNAVWANQVVERGDFSKSRVKVIDPEKESKRVYLWLGDNFPKVQYFRLQLGRSLEPILLISEKRSNLTQEEKTNLRNGLMKFMPYIRNIKILNVEDSALINEAEEGLKTLSVNYQKKNYGNKYSFNINGELNDSEILRLKFFINEFYRQWGAEFIVFNVALQTEPFKNKSYATGVTNYVKTRHNEWYFIEKEDNKE